MTRVHIRLAALLLLTVPLGAVAAEGTMAGAWDLKIVSPQGTRTPKLMLTQTGNQLTGTYHGMRGESPIAGTLTGNDFSLTTKVETRDASLVIEYRGVLSGDKVSGKVLMGSLGETGFTGVRR
jgi:hypothetical protein